MPVKPLYGVYVWLTPESSRRYNPDMYGGARANDIDHALQCFMHQHSLSYVEQAMVVQVSEEGELLGGAFRYQVFCPVQRQGRVSDHFQQRMNRLFPLE